VFKANLAGSEAIRRSAAYQNFNETHRGDSETEYYGKVKRQIITT
jgi:hypothetical protein